MAEQKKSRYLVWFIMILVGIGLLGFGTGGLSGNVRSIGTVGDKDISVASYQNILNQQIRAFEAQVGSRVGFQQAQAFGIVDAAQAQLITNRTLDNEASQLGISVGDERVRAEVLQVPAFQGLNGQFDREAYRNTLQRNGLTERDFEDSIREEMARTLLQGGVVGGVPAPTAYADALVQFVGEERDFVWATVTAADLTAPIAEPTDADLTAYYEANPDQFTKPEAREITYAWLTPNMIQDSLDVDENIMREVYNERIADFVRPERRLVERLVFVDQAAATTALERVNAGEINFDDLVAERGLDLSDVDLGDVAIEDLGAAGETVFAATSGDVVGPLNSSLGPALFRMNAVLAAEEITFEEASVQLREELSADRARAVILDSSEIINDLIAGGATLEDLAAETDMTVGQISWTEADQSGIAAYDAFRTAASQVQEGDFPELLNLADGGVFALRLNSITPPTLQPFEEVTEAVARGWNAQATQDAVIARAEELATEIAPLTNFETLGLVAKTETGLTRRSFVEGTPPGFMLEIFEMDVAATKVIDNANSAIIVRLDNVNAPNTADVQSLAERQSVGDAAAAGIAQDIFQAFSASVQGRTDVAIDQNVLNAVHAQFQ